MPRSWIALTLLALTLAVSGCEGEDDSEKKADSPGARAETAQKEDARRPGKSRKPREAAAARREAADAKRQERELKDLEREDREFDRSFKDTPFERLVNKLPIREPSLYVEQYITGDGHKLYTAVDRRRFCKTSREGREQAVGSFFRAADRSFRRAGVKDLEQVVTPVSETLDKLPALAIARRGSVSLTSLGRSC